LKLFAVESDGEELNRLNFWNEIQPVFSVECLQPYNIIRKPALKTNPFAGQPALDFTHIRLDGGQYKNNKYFQ
jgi:hypothetical protein